MPLPNTCKKREYCSALADNVVSQVTFKIGQIDQLLAVYADLVERVQQRPPDLVEMTAMASVLHSFTTVWRTSSCPLQKDSTSRFPLATNGIETS
jgi:hypothetical protein